MHEEYEKKVKSGISVKQALDELGIKRYCCRRMFISYVNLADEVIHHRRL